MMKKKYIILFFILLFSSFLLMLSLNLKGNLKITDWSIINLPDTWNIEHNLLLSEGKRKILFSKRSVERSVEALPYIKSADVKINGNTVNLSGVIKEGLIILSGYKWYFYSDELYALDKRDVYDIKDEYIILVVDEIELLLGKAEKRMIESLISLSSSNCLITSAEYDNNNSSVFSGSLTVNLDSISSKLVIGDIREIDRLEEALKIIENEYLKSKDRLGGEIIEYSLSSGSLIKMR